MGGGGTSFSVVLRAFGTPSLAGWPAHFISPNSESRGDRRAVWEANIAAVRARDVASIWPGRIWRRRFPYYGCNPASISGQTAAVGAIVVELHALRVQIKNKGFPPDKSVPVQYRWFDIMRTPTQHGAIIDLGKCFDARGNRRLELRRAPIYRAVSYLRVSSDIIARRRNLGSRWHCLQSLQSRARSRETTSACS